MRVYWGRAQMATWTGLVSFCVRTVAGASVHHEEQQQWVYWIDALVKNHGVLRPGWETAAAVCCVLMAVGVLVHMSIDRRRRRQCYLVDYTSYKPTNDRKMNSELCVYFEGRKEDVKLLADELNFQWRVYLRSGLGEETYIPGYIMNEDYSPSHKGATVEVEECFVSVLDNLFMKTQVKPSDIDVLIVSVSAFIPTPSLTSIIVNRYRMKENIKTFNLSGMGCSAGVIGVDMAKDLFKVYPDTYVLVVCTESITLNRYEGRDKSMRVTNCLFRVGGSALLLSNKPEEASRAKMRLLHTVRMNIAANDDAYNAVFQREDADGVCGVSLSMCLMDVAAEAVRRNMVVLGPKVLPLAEQLRFAYSLLRIKLFKMNLKPYVPNFKLAFDHFCIHPGGRAVVNGIGKNLKLSDYDLEPSRMALHRFGNTSASGHWYECSYLEAKERFKSGDRLWQLALGSGFKCNTAVWAVLRDILPSSENVWNDCLHRYPCDLRNSFPDDYCHRWLGP